MSPCFEVDSDSWGEGYRYKGFIALDIPPHKYLFIY